MLANEEDRKVSTDADDMGEVKEKEDGDGDGDGDGGKRTISIRRGRGRIKKSTETNVKELCPKGRGELMSKAIVVYGSLSPMSEMVTGIEWFGLKQMGEELENLSEGKRRKLVFEDEAANLKLHKVVDMKQGERRSDRIIKRRLRGKGLESGEFKVVAMVDRMEIVGSKFGFSAGALDCKIICQWRVVVTGRNQSPRSHDVYCLELSGIWCCPDSKEPKRGL